MTVSTGAASTMRGQWNSITLKYKDEATWTLVPNPNKANAYRLSRIANLLNQGATLNRLAGGDLIDTITDDSAHVLLQFGYQSGYLSMLSDVAGPALPDRRQVSFTFGSIAGVAGSVLTSVSQIAATGGPFNAQWSYAYQAWNGSPLLNSVGVPNPKVLYDIPVGGMKTHPIVYDTSSGTVSSLVDANGNTRVFSFATTGTTVTVFDPVGNLVERATQNVEITQDRNSGTTDANGLTSTVAYGDPANQYQATLLHNRNAQDTNAAYDAVANLVTVDVPSHGAIGGRLTTANTFDKTQFALGRLTGVSVGNIGTSYSYYPSGLLHTVTLPLPGGQTSFPHIDYTYSALGNVLTVASPRPTTTRGQVTYQYNYTTDGLVTKTEALGEPLTATDPLAHTTHFRYDGRGNTISVITPLGDQTDSQYDVADGVTRITYPATGQTGAGRAFTTFTYLYPGGPVRSCDPRGQWRVHHRHKLR